MGVTYAGKPAIDPKALLDECYAKGIPPDVWRGRANYFQCPNDRRWGTGAVLLVKSDLDLIDLTQSQSLIFDDGDTTKTLKNIVVTRYQCVIPGAADDPNAAYLVELADRRFFAARRVIDAAYNLRSSSDGSYITSTLLSGTAYTWTQLVSALWTVVGTAILGTYPGLPFTPDGTPENWNFFGGNAWEALLSVVERIGCTVTYDPEADTFAIVQLGTDTSAATDATNRLALRDRTWEDYGFDPDRGWRPEKVRVLFRVVPTPAEGTSPWSIQDVTLAAASGVEAGTYVTLYDDLGATGSNGAALASRAAERAADWLRVAGNYVSSFVQSVVGVYADLPKTVGPTIATWGLRDLGPSGLQSEVGAAAAIPMERFRMPVEILSGSSAGNVAIVKATASGSSVACYIQADDGAGGLTNVGSTITVKKFTAPARENFETNGYYIAVRVGAQWYAETGPLTECVTINSSICVDGSLVTTPITVRVINRACP